MKPVLERTAAMEAGQRFYETGKPCRNGHLSKRYTGTGTCAACGVRNTMMSQAKRPDHPARVAAREIGQRHYQRGQPCKHGHPDKWFVANGICCRCSRERADKWIAANPGNEAAAARRRRAKDPTGHRAEVKLWREKNKERAYAALKRWKAANIEHVRATGRAAVNRRRTRVANNGGSFTAADIEALLTRQNGACAVCPCTEGLEIDHILPIVLGGSSDPSNLQMLCRPCNRSKGGKHPDDWRAALKLRAPPYSKVDH